MAEAEDFRTLRSKRKAIMALLLYAVRLERGGRPHMFDEFLRAARASRMWFGWPRIRQSVATLFSEASPRAIVLSSPYIPWNWPTGGEDLVRRWGTAASVVPHTEEAGQSVIDTLLQIASDRALSPHIPINTWLWLARARSLPPVCRGRRVGTDEHVVWTVQGLNNIELLKSYLLLVWSEWDSLPTFGIYVMRTSFRDDFSGVRMAGHRAELIQRLDYVLEQLDRGSEYIERDNLHPPHHPLKNSKNRYRKLRKVLLEVERGTSCPMIVIFCTLTQVEMQGKPP